MQDPSGGKNGPFSRVIDFHYVSFVNQIGKPLSFVLFLTQAGAILNEIKRKIFTRQSTVERKVKH
ncbi:hypothetical protein, partial [Micrococcus sp. KRD096]|uniref:hypothetical protein n=1 Tax=Micrococcus sp. KRD096 TaxID=2729721 RepID=UPI0019CFC014